MKKILLIILVCLLGATNMFAQTQGSLSGLFSVSATTKVRFSQGNLQYQASTNTWRFAENQYDCIGKAGNEKISKTYTGWIDLFGWGTSGWDSGANAYQPYSTNTYYSDYYLGGLPKKDLIDSYANADWGVYNAILNGGNSVGYWRTLTHNEWEYVLTTRAYAFSRRGLASVNGVTGMVLLPDNWTTPAGITFKSNEKSFSSNTYSASDWSKMEANGAVFLPAAGFRLGTDVREVGYTGRYWSSSTVQSTVANDNNDYVYGLYIQQNEKYGMVYLLQRHFGSSVRLVQNSTVSANYTITTSALPTEGGMVTEGGSFVYGTNKTIEATPNPDYQFVMWDDGSTDNPRSIVVTGNATYTATFSYVGHSYGVPTYEWNTDSTQCTATRICSNNVSHIETETATSSIDTTAATCINTGLVTYTVNFTNTAFTAQTVTKEIPALGHDYEKDSWSWSSDYKTASLKFICQNDANHIETINAKVTIDTIEATCLNNGKIVYTATAIIGDSEYSETTDATLQIEVRPRLNNNTIGKFSLCGSDYQFLIKSNDPWTELQFEIWKEGVKCSKTDFAASNLNTHSDWVQPDNWYFNASQNNVTGYWLIYNPTENTLQYQTSEPNCMEYTDTKEVILPAPGHTEIIDNPVVPTCTTTGVTEGKHCSVCGSTIIAQTKLPALGHTYIKDSWTWASDFSSASVKFICQNDASHVETINAVVTTDTTKATCMADGKIVYTAKATFEGTEYTDTKEVTLLALKPTTHTITEISYGVFSLNGQTYNESGVYTQILTNSQGCDSVLTINLIVKKEEDLELSVLEQFTTCEYRDAIQIESYTEGMNFTWSINGEIDKTQTDDTYRIPSSAPLNGIVKVTGTIGIISISKTIQYSIYKEIAKKMWDDVVSIINPKHEFVAFEWYHNDKKISNAEYYNELGGVTGSYYVIATDKENEKIHSCILNFEADSQLKLFPNPTEGEVTFINDGNTEVRIFDTTGKLLATETIIPADGYSTIDLSSYPQGIYYLHIGKNIFKVVRK